MAKLYSETINLTKRLAEKKAPPTPQETFEKAFDSYIHVTDTTVEDVFYENLIKGLDLAVPEMSKRTKDRVSELNAQAQAEKSLERAGGKNVDINEERIGAENVKAVIIGDRFKNFDQCFLLVNEDEIRKKIERDYSDYRFGLLTSGENQSTILEKLVISNHIQNAFEFGQDKLAYLIPKLKINIRKYLTEDKKSFKRQPLIFDENLKSQNIQSITQSGFGRAAGVGIKSFDWTWVSFTGHERDQDIRGNLKLVFQSIEDFIQDSYITKRKLQEISGMELNTETRGASLNDGNIIKEAQFYRNNILIKEELSRSDAKFVDLIPELGIPGLSNVIEIITGWNIPPNMKNFYTKKEIETIEKMSIILAFNVTGYNINIMQNGTIELSVRLQGWIESVFSSPYLDIFMLANHLPDIEEETRKVTETIGQGIDLNILTFDDIQNILTSNENMQETHKRRMLDAGANGNLEEYSIHAQRLEQSEKMAASVEKTRKYVRYSALPRLLHSEKKMYKAKVKIRSLSGEVGDILEMSGDELVIEQHIPDDVNQYFLSEDEEANSRVQRDLFYKNSDLWWSERDQAYYVYHTVDFFFLGDIINVLTKLLYETKSGKDTFNNLRILVGPVTIGGNTVNMADIPISYSNFMSWYWDKIRTGGEDFYPLKDFLKDFLDEFLLSMYRNCVGLLDKQIDLNIINFSVNSNQGFDPITKSTNSNQIENKVIDIDQLDVKEIIHKEGKYSYEYMMLYGVQYFDQKTPNIEMDNKRGIVHLKIGSDRGLLKYVSFDRDEIPEMDSFRTLSGEVMGYVWKAKVHLYGIPKFYPTQIIYIDPTLMGVGDPIAAKEYSKYLGLGGYHQIMKVSSRINFSGKYETVLDTIPVLNYQEDLGRMPKKYNEKEMERIQKTRQRYIEKKQKEDQARLDKIQKNQTYEDYREERQSKQVLYQETEKSSEILEITQNPYTSLGSSK